MDTAENRRRRTSLIAEKIGKDTLTHAYVEELFGKYIAGNNTDSYNRLLESIGQSDRNTRKHSNVLTIAAGTVSEKIIIDAVQLYCNNHFSVMDTIQKFYPHKSSEIKHEIERNLTEIGERLFYKDIEAALLSITHQDIAHTLCMCGASVDSDILFRAFSNNMPSFFPLAIFVDAYVFESARPRIEQLLRIYKHEEFYGLHRARYYAAVMHHMGITRFVGDVDELIDRFMVYKFAGVIGDVAETIDRVKTMQFLPDVCGDNYPPTKKNTDNLIYLINQLHTNNMFDEYIRLISRINYSGCVQPITIYAAQDTNAEVLKIAFRGYEPSQKEMLCALPLVCDAKVFRLLIEKGLVIDYDTLQQALKGRYFSMPYILSHLLNSKQYANMVKADAEKILHYLNSLMTDAKCTYYAHAHFHDAIADSLMLMEKHIK